MLLLLLLLLLQVHKKKGKAPIVVSFLFFLFCLYVDNNKLQSMSSSAGSLVNKALVFSIFIIALYAIDNSRTRPPVERWAHYPPTPAPAPQTPAPQTPAQTPEKPTNWLLGDLFLHE